jgi:hypothetical protein
VPDTGWGNAGGEGVRVNLSLELSTLGDLRDLFGYLHDAFGLSSNGSFTIHQDGACWHGVGVRNLLETLVDPWSRYHAAGMRRVHHSESISYFDQFRSGWLAVTTQLRVPEGPDAPSFFHLTDLCIQLPGVPVDVAPYLELCRYTGNPWAEFQTVSERRTHTRRLKNSVPLQVIATLVRRDDDRTFNRWIVGLVARNPFFGKKRLPRELQLEGSPLHDLQDMGLMLCDLKDHIQEGDQVDQFTLQGVETTDAQHVQIIRPFATWNKIVKRRDGRPVDEMTLKGIPTKKRPTKRGTTSVRRRRTRRP